MDIKEIKHVAIIPDGNRRWAKKKSLQTSKGHEAGFKALRTLLKECRDSGPKYLSFYAFSTENFNRSQKEISQLFSLLENVIDDFSKELKDKVQLRISGSDNGLPPKLLKKLQKATTLCSSGEFLLNICFNYGAQEELIHIGKTIAQQSIAGQITEDDITKEYIEIATYSILVK